MSELIEWKSRLHEHRNYLRLLARMNLPRKLRSKLDESDIIQNTLLHAVNGIDNFRGTTEAELTAWLRQILSRNLSHALRDFARAKRDVAREQSMAFSVEQSSIRIVNWLQSAQPSPSENAVNAERVLKLADALEDLPETQRKALELHYIQGQSIADISQTLNRSASAVGGLLHRGLKGLREIMAKST